MDPRIEKSAFRCLGLRMKGFVRLESVAEERVKVARLARVCEVLVAHRRPVQAGGGGGALGGSRDGGGPPISVSVLDTVVIMR